MECPKCKSVPPEGAKFCNACGNKLEIACPECGKASSPVSTFCIECGHNLIHPSELPSKKLSFDEKIDKIQRYLPRDLLKKSFLRKTKLKVSADKSRIKYEDNSATALCKLETAIRGVCQEDTDEIFSFVATFLLAIVKKN